MDWKTRLAESSLATKIALVTFAAWAIIAALNLQQWAFVFGGFIPNRIDGDIIVNGTLPAILTPLSATLLHADFMHVGFNMLLFWFCGRGVEQATGRTGLLFVFIVGAYVAAGGHYLFNMDDNGPMVGASGAVSAVLGAYAMLFSKPREGQGGWQHVASLAGAWIIFQLLIGLTTLGSPSRIAIMAHIFGFFAGLAMAKPLLLWRYRDA